MFFFTHSTRRLGLFLNATCFLANSFSKNCLKGVIIISFSTRGDNSSLLALKLSSRIIICISLKSLALKVESKLIALSKRS